MDRTEEGAEVRREAGQRVTATVRTGRGAGGAEGGVKRSFCF